MADCTLTDEEAATYDRQIRLWGLDAQKRLRASKVLVAGIGGLGAEVCKNLVLAGVKSLCVLDDRQAGPQDIGSHFLISREDFGKSAAEAACKRLQQLNPNVEVAADTSDITATTEDFFARYDVVCLTRCSRATLERVNKTCHQRKIKFFAGDVFGFHGYFFLDLTEQHTYVIERKTEKMKKKAESIAVDEDSSGESAAKRPKLDEIVSETKMIEQKASFVDLVTALDTHWVKTAEPRKIKRTSSVFFAFLVVLEFREKFGHLPTSEEDMEGFFAARDSVEKDTGIAVSDEVLRQCLSELSPSCAVVGGVLSQEIIKAVSAKDTPLNNFFFYHGVDGCGMVEQFGR